MNNVGFECKYCGHRWEALVKNHMEVELTRCTRGNCNTSNLIVKDLTKTKVDYYVGCQPFPVERLSYADMYDYGSD